MDCIICGKAHSTCTGAAERPLLSPEGVDVSIVTGKRERPGSLWTSDRRLYLNAAGVVVGEKDPARQTLLVAQGGTLPVERAQELGLLNGPAATEPEGNPAGSEPDAAPKKRTAGRKKLAEDKSVPGPEETKDDGAEPEGEPAGSDETE